LIKTLAAQGAVIDENAQFKRIFATMNEVPMYQHKLVVSG
jgi:hypothetical protein